MIRLAVSAVLLFGSVAAAEDAASSDTASSDTASSDAAPSDAASSDNTAADNAADLAALAAPIEGDPFSIEPKGRLSVAVRHAFVRTEAATRLSYLLAYWKKRFNIESQWHGDRVFLSGTVYGIKIQAMFAINDSSVVGFAHDPGWPWRGQVQSYVDRKLKKYLNLNYDEP